MAEKWTMISDVRTGGDGLWIYGIWETILGFEGFLRRVQWMKWFILRALKVHSFLTSVKDICGDVELSTAPEWWIHNCVRRWQPSPLYTGAIGSSLCYWRQLYCQLHSLCVCQLRTADFFFSNFYFIHFLFGFA